MIISAWAFSRWMALIYLMAFWSLGVQILGLVGSHGILPTSDFLHYVAQAEGTKRFWAAPTLCWLNSSDTFLLFLSWGGIGLSILLLLGIMPAITAFLLWVFYLSLTIVGQDFLGFQWDNLLLEAGFLLIFLVPKGFKNHFKAFAEPSIIIIWLFRWLLFRLIFESGVVKLLSGDTHWAHLTALTFHYWTQPLPNAISWYAHQLPLWFQKLSCCVMFTIELLFPFLIFGGRGPRLIAFFGIVGFQVLIILTGNYCFFNLLAIGLCLTLLEDEHYLSIQVSLRALPFRARQSFLKEIASSLRNTSRNDTSFILYRILTYIIAAVIIIVSSSLILDSFFHLPLPKPIAKLVTALSPLRSINNYGLFAVMTTERNEIILEGSNDGENWIPYEFPFKPGDINQAPRWATPYQPRLDWQMWFASLSSWRDNQWLLSLMNRLLQGEPSVVHLFANNPFKDHPPKYIQAAFWEYHFTDFKTKGFKGPWWDRKILGLYCPTLSLQ